MEQLVGCACAVCGERIGSILDSRFCSTCGNAVHHACARPADASARPDHCSVCGCDRSNPTARRVQFERTQPPGAGPGGVVPVGSVCLACGHAAFKGAASQKWVAYVHDRVCLACGTRYTPPTPAWARVAMTMVGLALLAVALVGGYFSAAAGDVIALGLEGFFGVLGALALRHGVRSLIRPGKA